jgi:hypothetical protein
MSADDACSTVAAVQLPRGVNSTAGDVGQQLFFVRNAAAKRGGPFELQPYADHCAAAFLAQNAGLIVYDAKSRVCMYGRSSAGSKTPSKVRLKRHAFPFR